MDLLTAVIVLALIGFCLYLVVTYIPMPPPMKQVIVVLVVVVVVLWIVRALIGGGPVLTLR